LDKAPARGKGDLHPPSPAAVQARSSLPPFFAVSLAKLAIMNLCTLGLYQLYWFHENWRCIRRREGADLSPARRTLLFPFFCPACFGRIRAFDRALNGRSRLHSAWLATGYLVMNLADLLPEPWPLITLLAFAFVLPVQACANRLNAQVCTAPFDRNTRIRGWNWLVVGVGGVLLIVGIVAAFHEAQR